MIYASFGGVINQMEIGLDELSDQLEDIHKYSHDNKECADCVKDAVKELEVLRTNLEDLKDLCKRVEALL